MKTVLIVDDNLGFLLWLGAALNNAGHKVVPAVRIAEATAVIALLKLKIDLLIIDPALSGATRFIRGLRRDREHLRVIGLIEDLACSLRSSQGIDVVRQEPSLTGVEVQTANTTRRTDVEASLSRSKTEWVTLVRTVLQGEQSIAAS